MSNKTYDILKDIALYVLPALATFILTIGGIWGIPNAEAIAGTITAIDTFLGAVLKISSIQYDLEEKKEDLASQIDYFEKVVHEFKKGEENE